MKKRIQKGLIFSLVILSGAAFGQQNDETAVKNNKITRTQFEFLLNLLATNFNYGKSNSSLADYKKSILSPQVGASMHVEITPGFTLVQELYFMMKGGRLESDNPLTVTSSTLRLYTLETPVLVRVNLNKYHINAGPSIAYNLYGSRKIDGSTSDLSFNNSDESFERWEAGVQFGGGFTFNLKQRPVVLDLRYNYGLTNISNTNEMYNRGFILSAHFKPWKLIN